MEHFSNSFLITLLHSLWQAALLLLLYSLLSSIFNKSSPLFKRNVLLILLSAQFCLSVYTFLLYQNVPLSLYSNSFKAGILSFDGYQAVLEKISPFLIVLYMLILIYKICGHIFSWRQFRFSYTHALMKPPVELRLFTIMKAAELGISKKIQLWLSNAITSPVTYGFFKPVILLPVALVNNLSTAEAESLIIHELSHIKNHDWLLNWISVLSDTLFFFNPFIRLMAGRLSLERELNCDGMVLQYKYAALDYSSTLLKTAKSGNRFSLFMMHAVRSKTQLLKRILYINDTKKETKKNYYGLALFPVLIVFFLLHLFLPKPLVFNEPNIKKYTEMQFPASLLGYPEIKQPLVTRPVAPVLSGKESIPAQKTPVNPVTSEKKTKKLQANDQGNTATAVTTPTPERSVLQVSLNENRSERKELFYKEEDPGTGQTVTRVYQLVKEGNEWKVAFMWTITESLPFTDSLHHSKDSLQNIGLEL